MNRTSVRRYLLVTLVAALAAFPVAAFATGSNPTSSTTSTSTTTATSTSSTTTSAGKPAHDTGVAEAISAITNSMNRQETRLQDLLAKVPASAQPGIQKAIAATTEGRAAALDILNAMQSGSGATGASASSGKSSSAQKDLSRVNKIVTDTRAAVAQDLKAAMANQPKQVREEIASAEKDVHKDSGDALTAIHRADREERMESATAESHEHERGETSTRASMASRPSRPETPGRR